MQFRLIVHHNFNLLATLVERVAHGGILRSDVLLKRNILAALFFHILRTLDQRLDVESGAGDGQQTDRREHREATAHVVGNHEGLVAFLVGAGTRSTALRIRHRHDHLASLVLATLFLALLLQQAERQRGFGRRARFRDVNHAKTLGFQVFREFKKVVLADVVAGEEDDGGSPLQPPPIGGGFQPRKRVSEGFDDGASTEIRTSDACHNHDFAFFAKRVGHRLHLVQKCLGNFRRQMQPTQKIITRTRAVFHRQLCRLHFRFESLHCAFAEEARRFRQV